MNHVSWYEIVIAALLGVLAAEMFVWGLDLSIQAGLL